MFNQTVVHLFNFSAKPNRNATLLIPAKTKGWQPPKL